jgi:hypothetical protein
MCLSTCTNPATPCNDAKLWKLPCAPPHDKEEVEATCSDECRKKEAELREWGRKKRERDEQSRQSEREAKGKVGKYENGC